MVSNDESMRCETCLHNSGSSGHSSFMKAFKVVNGNAPQSVCIHCMLGSRWRRIDPNRNKMEKSLPYALLLHPPLSLPFWTVRNNSEQFWSLLNFSFPSAEWSLCVGDELYKLELPCLSPLFAAPTSFLTLHATKWQCQWRLTVFQSASWSQMLSGMPMHNKNITCEGDEK